MPILYKLNNARTIYWGMAIFLMLMLIRGLFEHIPSFVAVMCAVTGGATIWASYYLAQRYSQAWVFLFGITLTVHSLIVPELLLTPADGRLYGYMWMLSLLFFLWLLSKHTVGARYLNSDWTEFVTKELNRAYSKREQYIVDHLSAEQLAEIDGVLLRQLSSEWRTVREVVGHALAELNAPFDSYPNSLLLNRLRKLAENGHALMCEKQEAGGESVCRLPV